MPTCTHCSSENPAAAKFCNECGSRLEPALQELEQRKTVTIIFCDVTGSTAMGESLDPESFRRVMARYFETAKAVIERHGGTVEKFIGDAVMAVFGVPVLHEDDALRAVKSADELRREIAGLNAELESQLGISFEVRIGINTGEVVTGTAERLATGDAVNVAARLEQAAKPGEILIGAETLQLVRDATVTERLDPLDLKGKSRALAAHRLLRVEHDQAGVARHLEAPMVGRAHQMTLLRDACEHVVRDQTCNLFTVLGTAGVGKSRLANEFLHDTAAMVLRGRCLPYGEGITYFPVIEVVQQVAAAGYSLSELAHEDAMAVAALGSLLGESEALTSAEEIAWAVRKLLEGAAERTPLIVVFDDIHWAEGTFLDLIEHIADFTRDRPILLLCIGRPELLERRPGWGGGKFNATTVLLEPLNGDEAEALIAQLGEDAGLDPDLRSKVRRAAEGNPLFIEEMVAMVRESGGVEVTVPPTIRALLAARLDQLERSERTVLERGAVEGQSFHRGAVQALAPEEHHLGGRLMQLVRKELVRPDRGVLPGEEAFRFRHLLIRDAAYDALSKSDRANLHERFADWLAMRGDELIERDEILGYHLEQAHRYRKELNPSDEAVKVLGQRAAEPLHRAGNKAFERGDLGAAVNLLERAEALVPDENFDVSMAFSLSWALLLCGRPRDAHERIQAVVQKAERSGDRVAALRARLELLISYINVDPEGRVPELETLIEEARPLFESAGDDAALAGLYQAIGWINCMRCRYGSQADAFKKALKLGARDSEAHLYRQSLTMVIAGLGLGPAPIPEATAEIQKLVEQDVGADLLHSRFVGVMMGWAGDIEGSRLLLAATDAALADRGLKLSAALGAQVSQEIEILAGDPEAAERRLRDACRVFEEAGEKSWFSTLAAQLAYVLAVQERFEEAEDWRQRSLATGGSEDIVNFMLSHRTRCKALSAKGEHESAVAEAERAVAMGETTEAPVFQGCAHLDLAEALMRAGDASGANREAHRAIEKFRAKGAHGWVRRAEEFLESVTACTA